MPRPKFIRLSQETFARLLLIIAALAIVLLLFRITMPDNGETRLRNPVTLITSSLDSLELFLLDRRLVFRSSRLSPSPDIIVVAYDRYTDTYIRQHPQMGMPTGKLSRTALAKVIDYLHAQGARAIVLDLEFDTSTPDDAVLAQSMRKAGNVYAAFRMDEPLDQKMQNTPMKGDLNPAEKAAFYKDFCTRYLYQQRQQPAFLDALNQNRIPVLENSPIPESLREQSTFCYSTPVVSPILESLKGIASSAVLYDSDALIREILVVRHGYKNNFYTYLGIRAALDLMGVDQLDYTPQNITLLKNHQPLKTMPLLDGWRTLINWRDPANLAPWIWQASGHKPDEVPKNADEDPASHFRAGQPNILLGGGVLYRNVSAIDILKADSLASDTGLPKTLYNIPGYPATGTLSFKDKIVIYGDTLKDVHQTPVAKITFGPEIMATVLDMVLHDHTFVHRSPLPLDIAIVLVLGSLLAWRTINSRRLSIGFSEGVLIIVIFWIANMLAFYQTALWIPLVIPTLALATSLVGATLFRYYIHDREERYLINAFSRYVSPQLMAQVLQDPQRVMENLRGQKKLLTVMFTDIRDFTRRLESGSPDVVIGQLNRYFDAMIQVILAYEGTYDKFLGDGLLVFFGAPVDLPDTAANACKAALAMQKALDSLNREFEAEGLEPLQHSIGISTGETMVGNFGSSLIKDFTVMGSTVNLAARLENYTRQTNADILINESTYERIKDWAETESLGRIKIRGFSEPVPIYALLKAKSATASPR